MILEVKDLGGKYIYMVKTETKYFSYFSKGFAYSRHSWNIEYVNKNYNIWLYKENEVNYSNNHRTASSIRSSTYYTRKKM